MLTLIRCPFHPHVSTVTHKRPRLFFAKSAGGRSHLNTHTPLTQPSRSGLNMLSRHIVGTYQGKKLTRNSLGNTRPQSSQLAELLWTDPGLKSEIGVTLVIVAIAIVMFVFVVIATAICRHCCNCHCHVRYRRHLHCHARHCRHYHCHVRHYRHNRCHVCHGVITTVIVVSLVITFPFLSLFVFFD